MSMLKEFSKPPVVDLKNSDATDAGNKDVSSKAKSSQDISFSLMRNTINADGKVSGSNIANYLERAAELNDEVDTVCFGLETSDGDIVKVYVNSEQADAFSEALKNLLGIEDDIEEAVNRLATEFDIIDVVWPVSMQDDEDGDGEPDPDADLSIDDASLGNEEDEDDDDMDVIAALDGDLPDEDSEDEDDEDTEKKKRKKALPASKDVEEDDDSVEESTEQTTPEKNMTIGSKFLNRVLAEAQDKDGVKDGFNIALDSQARALASKMKRPYEKKLVAFLFMVGVTGRYLNTTEIEGSISDASDMLRKRISVRRAFDTFYSALAGAKGFTIPKDEAAESLDEAAKKRGGFVQKLFEGVLTKLGLPESMVVTTGPAAVGTGIFRTSQLIEQNSDLEQSLRMLAARLGVKAADDVMGEELDEAIDVGNDDFSQQVIDLAIALGIPEVILVARRPQIIAALRKKRQTLGNRARLMTLMTRLATEVERGSNAKEPVTEAFNDAINKIIDKLVTATKGSRGAVRAFWLGGSSSDLRSYTEKMEKMGMGTDGGWAENKDFFKKLNLSNAEYMKLVKASA